MHFLFDQMISRFFCPLFLIVFVSFRMNTSRIIMIVISISICVWLFVMIQMTSPGNQGAHPVLESNPSSAQAIPITESSSLLTSLPPINRRETNIEVIEQPPSMEEVHSLLRSYLSLLHKKFGEIVGHLATPVSIWNTYYQVYNQPFGRYLPHH